MIILNRLIYTVLYNSIFCSILSVKFYLSGSFFFSLIFYFHTFSAISSHSLKKKEEKRHIAYCQIYRPKQYFYSCNVFFGVNFSFIIKYYLLHTSLDECVCGFIRLYFDTTCCNLPSVGSFA